jgi:hypothetical protein
MTTTYPPPHPNEKKLHARDALDSQRVHMPDFWRQVLRGFHLAWQRFFRPNSPYIARTANTGLVAAGTLQGGRATGRVRGMGDGVRGAAGGPHIDATVVPGRPL